MRNGFCVSCVWSVGLLSLNSCVYGGFVLLFGVGVLGLIVIILR